MTGFEVSGFTIPAGLVVRAFGTALPAVSRDGIPPISGVYVEWSEERGRVSFAATNRFVAVVASIATQDEDRCRGEGAVLLSRENVRSLVSTFKRGAREAHVPVSFELRADDSLVVSDGERTASYRGVDARFPRSVFGLAGSAVARIESGDWTPKSVSGLDPKYLKLVLDAAKHATPKGTAMRVYAPQTEGPAFFDLVGDDRFSAAALLMPVLLKSTPETTSVGWLKDEAQAAA